VHDKLIRRHPHVFADVEATTADDVVSTWDEVKRGERAAKGTRASFFDGVARSAPSLALAQKIQKRAAEVGFDWPDSDGALAKLDEETHELRAAIGSGDPQTVALEVGDVLFSVVNVVRKLGLDAEATLRTATDKFIARFEGVVRIAGERGIALESASLAQLDSLWDEVKAQTTLGS
jgi:MazG family protein